MTLPHYARHAVRANRNPGRLRRPDGFQHEATEISKNTKTNGFFFVIFVRFVSSVSTAVARE